MDMGKYVAVGVLAVIVLAAVTYDAPKEPGGAADPQRITGEVGPRAEAPPPDTPPAEPAAAIAPPSDAAPVATSSPTTSSMTAALPAGAAPAALEAAAPELLKYTVKAGQNLSDVAQEFLGDRGRWRELVRHNQGQLPNPDLVRAGLTLVFPAQEVTRAPAATTVAASTPRTDAQPRPGERSYTVARGDTLYSIARRELGNGGRWRELVALNGLQTETVAAGTKLRLPGR